MKFYHGTTFDKWELIKKEGVLWGYNTYKNPDGSEYKGYRYTYLTPHIQIAKKFGDIILEVEYEPVGINGKGIDNYCFDHQIPKEELEKGATCWQFSVFVPISIENIKKI